MNFTELTRHDGSKYLYDFDTGWEIYDKGDKPAFWSNNREGRNMDATETYADLRARFISGRAPDHSLCAADYQMARDSYDRALEKLVMARTFMTLEAQRAFDAEWDRHMLRYKANRP